MDEIALRKALATLRSLRDNFPKGSTIEEKYVAYYHQLLSDIGKETGQDLGYFQVPAGEVHKRWTGSSGGDLYGEGREDYYTDHAMVDRGRISYQV